MRERFLSFLSDPLSGESFQLTCFEEEGGQVLSGFIESATSWYPIIGGIPRILTGELRTGMLQARHEFYLDYLERFPEHIRREWQAAIDAIADMDSFLRHQKKTAESFAYEWKNIYRENSFEKENFYHFLSPYLREADLRGKLTVDIGCGSGRFTKWAALAQTEASFGTDLGESVEVAYEMTKDLPNACIVQADIYAMPFRGVFDIAYSIGVLHHLPQPKSGFSRLPGVLKEDGRMLIWVYNRRNNARAIYFYEPLRSLLKHFPKPLLFKLCYIPGGTVHLINLFSLLLKRLGLSRLSARMPFTYYENFPFNMKLNDAFDVLATPKSNYYRVEEIERWFSDASLRDIQAYEHPEAGITCIGTYAG